MEKVTEYITRASMKLEEEYTPLLTDSLAAHMENFLDSLRDGTEYPTRAKNLVTGMIGLSISEAISIAAPILDEHIASLTTNYRKAISVEQADRIKDDFIRRHGTRQITQIHKTTETQIAALMRGGLARGEATEAVYAQIINRIPSLAAQRSEIITQTEIHSAIQFASQTIAGASGLRLRKVWDSVNDERTRDFGEVGAISAFNHRVMSGQSVPLDGKFAVPVITGAVERLNYPGDPNGSAGNIINCRCSQFYTKD